MGKRRFDIAKEVGSIPTRCTNFLGFIMECCPYCFSEQVSCIEANEEIEDNRYYYVYYTWLCWDCREKWETTDYDY